MRDINLEDTIYPRFATKAFATNIPTTLLGTPVLAVYEENNLTQITTGVSLTVDYDSITGFNQAAIVATAANGYEIDKSYDLVITTGTVDGVSVVGDVVFSFTVGVTENQVWDAVLDKITHNVSKSAAKLLRNLAATVVRQDTAQGSGTGSNQIQLDTGASTIDGAYDPSIVSIVDGTGTGQARLILQYDGTTKTATVDRDWKVNPDNSSEFLIIADAGREHVNEGLAQGGTTTTITLNALASSRDNAYIGQTIFIRSGFGADQAGLCLNYDGTTKIATIAGVWSDIPNTTSAYVMLSTSLYDDTAVSNIATGAAAPSVPSESSILTTGTEVNTYIATHILDGTYNETSDTAGIIDRYYQFDIGNDHVATSVAVNGRLEGDNDFLDIYAYNWITTSWERIGGLEGNAPGFADIVSVYTVITDYTGIGINLNKVRIRFAGTGLTSATLFIDRIVTRHAAVPAPTVIENRQEMDDNSTKLDDISSDTNELQTAHAGGNLGVDVDKINGVTLVGNGTTIPIGA